MKDKKHLNITKVLEALYTGSTNKLRMDQSQRLDLITNSVGSTNKKLNDVLYHKEEFLVALGAFRENLDPNSSFKVRSILYI